MHGSWGYKEYMSVSDLLEFKEKYLTKNCANLNLNCKIVLFYTLTVKTNLNTSGNEINLATPLMIKENGDEILSVNLSPSNRSTTKNEVKSHLDPLEKCNTLLYDLKRFFNHSDMYDLIIQAPLRLDSEFQADCLSNQQFKQFKVHKLILSIRSEVFEAMFKQNINVPLCMSSVASNDNMLKIVDFDAFVVETFLSYLYTDVLEINLKKFKLNFNFKCLDSLKIDEDGDVREKEADIEDNEDIDENKSIQEELYTHLFIELYKISDKYCVYRLKSICEKQLIKMVSVETCVELLILSFLHNSMKLKQKCFDFLSGNASNIIQQASWIHLEKNYPILLAEAFRYLYFRQGIHS